MAYAATRTLTRGCRDVILLKDLAVTGTMVLFSVFAFAYAGIWFPAVIAGAYAFLTIQVEDTTIMDFIRYACAYFLTTQQYFEWRYTSDE